MSRVPYASAVGNLMYVMICTHLAICFVVSLVSHYQSNPGPTHWQAVTRIFRYLKGNSDLILCLQGGDLRLKVFNDANWGGDRDERKSTSGYVFMPGGGGFHGAA